MYRPFANVSVSTRFTIFPKYISPTLMFGFPDVDSDNDESVAVDDAEQLDNVRSGMMMILLLLLLLLLLDGTCERSVKDYE
jgi:hypothetical protein